jgi:hypothetical protein
MLANVPQPSGKFANYVDYIKIKPSKLTNSYSAICYAYNSRSVCISSLPLSAHRRLCREGTPSARLANYSTTAEDRGRQILTF